MILQLPLIKELNQKVTILGLLLFRIEGYSQPLSMQRMNSILALIAVLCQVGSPLWASATEMHSAMVCHRMPMQSGTQSRHTHHCHMAGMMVSETENSPIIASSNVSEKCPMNCCIQAAPPTVAALPPVSLLPQPHVMQHSVSPSAVTFASPGFSSHTDRGPPSVL